MANSAHPGRRLPNLNPAIDDDIDSVTYELSSEARNKATFATSFSAGLAFIATSTSFNAGAEGLAQEYFPSTTE